MSDSATLTGLVFLGRALQFGSGMLLVNVAVFRWLVLPPALARGDGESAELQRFLRRLDFAFMACAVLLVISGGLLFLAAAAGMSGTPLAGVFDRDLLATVLLRTQFGRVCQLRCVLAVTLGVVVWSLHRSRGPFLAGALRILAAILAGALFLSVAWTGHAAAVDRPGIPWPRISDTAHLACTSIWPAGLLPFALFLGSMRQADRSHRAGLVTAVRRFSTVSLLAVIALALTGAANSFFLIGTFGNLVGTTYGRLLCLKLFVFAFMLAVAAWNRQVLVPRLVAAGDRPDADGSLAVIQSLRLFVIAELCLAAVVILVVSVLGVTPPPALLR